MHSKALSAVSAIIVFIISFLIFLLASGLSLGFADSAEFALICKLRSIAHAPGFPAYVLFTWALSSILNIILSNYIFSLVCISILYASLASALFFLTIIHVLQKNYAELNNLSKTLIAAISALAICTGTTIWHWSTMVEVYSLQMLAFSGTIYFILKFVDTSKKTSLLFTAFFIGIGLSNHHLTMILFLPFLPFFFLPNFLNYDKVAPKKLVSESTKVNYFSIIISKKFLTLSSLTLFVIIFFYGWMFIRASDEIVFKFGNPNNLSRLWYHLIGGSWIGHTQKEVHGLVAKRIPFFLHLFYNQFLIYTPIIVLGLIEISRKKMYKFLTTITLYFIIVLIYQLRIDQYADTDAYMIFPFFVLSFSLPFGLAFLATKKKLLLYIGIIILPIQAVSNFQKVKATNFNVSKSLMNVLNYSTPKNAVIIVSDWTLVSQFYYYQIVENFRPDIIMMNYDVKFCNHKNFPLMYPSFYKKISNPYNNFVSELGAKHPQDIYNTGCNLDSDFLLKTYANCIQKIIETAKSENRPVLYDPKTFVFLTKYNIIKPDAFVSGCFVSAQKSKIGKEFLKLKELDFLKSPLMLNEPAAADKLIDVFTMLEFSQRYYSAYNDTAALISINNSSDILYQVRNNMKKNMKFLFQTSAQ